MMQTISSRTQGDFAALLGILFLFFFQLISDFVEAIYVFGLLGTSIPAEIVTVLFFLSPIVLLGFRKRPSRGFLLLMGGLVLFCTVVESLLDTRGKMIASGIGVAAFLIFLPALFATRSERNKFGAIELGAGLMFGLAGFIFIRTYSEDIVFLNLLSLVFNLIFSLLAGILTWRIIGGKDDESFEDENVPKGISTGRVILLCLGIASAFLLLYFAFVAPNVIARWTGANYLVVLILLWSAILVTAGFWFRRQRIMVVASARALWFWNGIFVLSMVLTILPHQVRFPAAPEGYPLLAPQISWFHFIPLYIMLLTFPVILVDFIVLTRELIQARPSTRQMGGGFTLAGLYMLVMILAHVFTTVYDYIPVVGPFFRDKFWLVYLALGLGLSLPLWLVRIPEKLFTRTYAETPRPAKKQWEILVAFGLLSVLSILFNVGIGALGKNQQVDQSQEAATLRVLTYNIQQGYSEDGRWNFGGQLEHIRTFEPDIIGLQESDTNRIAGGNLDVVGYFASQLDMYSYYSPSPVVGTFGIALLSKYPIENPKTYYMYSEGEQVAAIEAQITVGGKVFNIFVTHLGNGGPMIQQEQFLEIIEGKENVIAMGDYNFRPPSDQYTLTVASLEDAHLLAADITEEPGFDPEDRIDHIFVSPGMTVTKASYLLSPESDHPALYADIEW